MERKEKEAGSAFWRLGDLFREYCQLFLLLVKLILGGFLNAYCVSNSMETGLFLFRKHVSTAFPEDKGGKILSFIKYIIHHQHVYITHNIYCW